MSFLPTSARLISSIKTCECGCLQTVPRTFKPGHDAKLKGRLVAAVNNDRCERSAHELVGRGWGHFAKAEALAAIPTRGRDSRGRFVESRHIEAVRAADVWVTERNGGKVHAHTGCTEIAGKWDFGTEQDGWACSTCIHTTTLAEQAAKGGFRRWVTEAPTTVWEVQGEAMVQVA